MTDDERKAIEYRASNNPEYGLRQAADVGLLLTEIDRLRSKLAEEPKALDELWDYIRAAQKAFGDERVTGEPLADAVARMREETMGLRLVAQRTAKILEAAQELRYGLKWCAGPAAINKILEETAWVDEHKLEVATAFHDAIDAWRGLTDDREWLYAELNEINDDKNSMVQHAVRLLKTAATR